ncbi:MAG: hypothetical protein QXH71_01685 [Candidatus Anstonellaceae archaeon]
MLKAQLAIEFIIVIAIFLFLLTPIFLFVQLNLYDQNSLAYQSKAYESFSRLSQSIKAVGNSGPKNSLEVKVFLPLNSKLGINNKDLYLTLLSEDGRTITYVYSSDFSLSLSTSTFPSLTSNYEIELPRGYYYFVVECYNFGDVLIKIF